ncbi:hypothetical protein NQK81_01350 [Amycolatopsis roodepoortensis]|uniref:hypothetical protein n=1 Tax=Amycolatopsis roodepoortensis TaxID=700274 RepID=UPI00214C8C87|nr:hypothetical protein [Amycolatopsis roodepoortensis]UUV32121.1 hypothetical protein NQK81_01350 [Amycolatopsis roodepoortensis]
MAKSILGQLLRAATDREAELVTELAVRAGLLRRCRCGHTNLPDVGRCERCYTRVLPDCLPRTAPAIGLAAIRRYLTQADDDDSFVAGCREGRCGENALAAVETVLAGAVSRGYSTRWQVIADEIIALVDERALADGHPELPPTATA